MSERAFERTNWSLGRAGAPWCAVGSGLTTFRLRKDGAVSERVFERTNKGFGGACAHRCVVGTDLKTSAYERTTQR